MVCNREHASPNDSTRPGGGHYGTVRMWGTTSSLSGHIGGSWKTLLSDPLAPPITHLGIRFPGIPRGCDPQCDCRSRRRVRAGAKKRSLISSPRRGSLIEGPDAVDLAGYLTAGRKMTAT